jgi:hypothetical protein
MSCTKELDFNQVNDFEINPILETSLIYFNAPAVQFYDNGEVLVSQDFVLIDIFNKKFTVDYLIKASLNFETINSINRAFQFDIDFVDINDVTQYSISILVPESINNQELVSEKLVDFEDDNLLALKRTAKLVFTITLQAGKPINETTQGKILLKSKGLFYFDTNNSL